MEETAVSELRRSRGSNAGIKRYDKDFQWKMMNLSVNTALRDFGDVADKACESELVQLFMEKKALVPMKWEDLTDDQKEKIVRSHLFLKEKFEAGEFVKLKAHLVPDGHTQDLTLYQDFSSPTARMRSVSHV